MQNILVPFSRSVMSNSLRLNGLQHTRLPCSSQTPWVYSNSSPLSLWCHPTISSSVIPFSWLQSFPALGSFPMSQLFTSGSQSIGASSSASVRSMNIQNWLPLGLTGWISLQSEGLSRIIYLDIGYHKARRMYRCSGSLNNDVHFIMHLHIHSTRQESRIKATDRGR